MLCPSLRISGQLPAPIVNGGEDSVWKWKDFQISRARDLDLGSGHTVYRRESLIDLNLHAKFIEIKKLWTGRTYVLRTDGHLRPTLLGGLRRVDLKTGHMTDYAHYRESAIESQALDRFYRHTKTVALVVPEIWLRVSK